MAMIYATTKSTAVTAFEAARGQIGNLGSKVVTFSKTTNGKVALGITAATTLVALVAIGYGIYKMSKPITASVINATDDQLRRINHKLAASKFKSGVLSTRENMLHEAVKGELRARNQISAYIAQLPQKRVHDLITLLNKKEELTVAEQRMLEDLKLRELEELELD